jgi:hypothetical protein|tara:strand:+ start:383 stop:583 length:201 start_codon:yes stop_codon:yes gene_type:complete
MAKSGETVTYHEGYLAKDRFFDYPTRDIANLFMRAYESKIVDLYQKRLKHGNINHDPKFQYIAKKL